MMKHCIIIFLTVILVGCSFSIRKNVEPISIVELQDFISKNNISDPVYKGDFNLLKSLKLVENERIIFPALLIVDKNLNIVYIKKGYSSSFKNDIKEAIDCNTTYCDLNSNYVKIKKQFEGKKVGNVNLTDIKGNNTDLQKLIKDNSLLLIDVWTTWCKPCLKAFKELDDLKNQYKETVKFVNITLDSIND